MDIPDTRYAKTPDDVYIAYQTFGERSIDLVWQFDLFGNLDVMWELPMWETFFRALAGFSRVILHDRRGTGLSSRNVPRGGVWAGQGACSVSWFGLTTQDSFPSTSARAFSPRRDRSHTSKAFALVATRDAGSSLNKWRRRELAFGGPLGDREKADPAVWSRVVV